MARIARVAPVVLPVKDTEEALDWYVSALGMELMAHDQEMELAFLSFGTRDHDIALIAAPEGVATGSPELSHTALMIEGGEPELRDQAAPALEDDRLGAACQAGRSQAVQTGPTRPVASGSCGGGAGYDAGGDPGAPAG